jgi:hypothetical protein
MCTSRPKFPSPGGGEFPVASLKMLGLFHFENLLEDGIHALTDPASTSSFTLWSTSCFFEVKCLISHSTHNLPDIDMYERATRSVLC